MRLQAAISAVVRWFQGRLGFMFAGLALFNVLLLLNTTTNVPMDTYRSYAGLPSTAPAKISAYEAINSVETTFVKGIAGVNLFENIFLKNGTFYIVTEDAASMPIPGRIMCAQPNPKSHPDGQHPPAGKDRLDYIHPSEAESVLGKAAIRKSGMSMFFNDQAGPNGQSFLGHYFHFSQSKKPTMILTDERCASLLKSVFFSAWRLATAAYTDADIPERLMYRTDPKDWRDRAGLTSWFQQSIMPKTAIEDSWVWEDRRASQMTYVFDKLVIVDRFSAHKHGISVGIWNKMTADLPLLEVPQTWMRPLRDSLKGLLHLQGCDLSRENPRVPIVTYVNRQLTGRRLVDEDAQSLLDEMNKLNDAGVIQFTDAKMEKFSRDEQFCLAMKTDILLGVHGNGLSHQLWMRPGGAVLEIMDSGGFAMDYALPADLLKHEYYAIHNDTFLPRDKWLLPNGRAVQQGENFHSDHIRVHGPYLGGLVSQLAAARSSPISPADL